MICYLHTIALIAVQKFLCNTQGKVWTIQVSTPEPLSMLSERSTI